MTLYTILFYAIWGLLLFWAGLWCGQRGVLCDSRLDRARIRERALVARLNALLSESDSFYHFVAIQKLGSHPGETAYELQKVRQEIILMGGQPCILPHRVMKLLDEQTQ